ncbi:hypothetical protein THAOC_03932 [Thalassiosira oceanica]|uniref:Uncharacterized protein n=1 Tax=Thalassiosira oceanica TaxID=159749 RepID=K0TB79_THAOC|nr:hypothetical protein THAOC_03932 [Thalassiosira oceanica]|eukprot:EJK74394.1 hypothetical protein THAOC_03932 [Thalassiosira oceanica]
MADDQGAESELQVETRLAARAADVGDIAVTSLVMPHDHRPTWRHLLPRNHFTDGVPGGGDAGGATGDQSADEPSVTMGDLRIRYDGCRNLEELRIPADVSFANSRLYSATYPGPIYGLIMIKCNGRVCIKESNPVVPRFECQVGSIVVAMNRRLIPYGAPFQRVLTVLRDALRHPPVTLYYVDNDDFISYFKESFLPSLPPPKIFKAPPPEKEDGESDLDYIARVFGTGFVSSKSSATREFLQVIANDESTKCWTMGSRDFKNNMHTWENVGLVLAANTNLESFHLEFIIGSAPNLTEILIQLQTNKSLRQLTISCNSRMIDSRIVQALSLYLHCDNNRVSSLALIRFEISGADFIGIAQALTGTKITDLSLVGSIFGGVNFRDASSAFNLLGQLKVISLTNCRLGVTLCKALCCYLPFWTNLEKMDLSRNRINNKCCAMLANALGGNTTMKMINLKDNTQINKGGVEKFAPILCNGSTLEGIEYSNHVLNVEYNVREDEEEILGCHPKGIRHLLSINMSSGSTASKVRRKIETVMFEGDFAVQRLAMMHVKLMPRTLRFLSHPHNKMAMNYKCSFAAMYHLIRNYDAAELFGFPSAERARIDFLERKNSELVHTENELRKKAAELFGFPSAERARIDYLERKNSELVHTENELRKKIRALEAEIEDLKKEPRRACKRHKSGDLVP